MLPNDFPIRTNEMSICSVESKKKKDLHDMKCKYGVLILEKKRHFVI